MAEFDNLIDKLADRAKEAADRVHASTSDTKEKLEAQVLKSRAAADKTTQELEAKVSHSQDETSQRWSQIGREWHDHIARIQGKIDAGKGKLDVSRAQHRAELAESDAIEAVDFAYMAIEWAEWAIVDAELARLDADELAGTRV